MGESVRLRWGTQRVFEEMVQRPEVVWSTLGIRAACNESEKAAEQVIEILLSSGAGTAVVAGSPVRIDPTMLGGYDYCFRLNDGGPEILRQVLEASRYSGGVIASLWFEGWEPAKAAWQARRAHRAARTSRRWRQRRGHDESLFNPYEGRRLGWLYRWIERRITKQRG